MQREIAIVEAQLAPAQIAPHRAADVAHSRHPLMSSDADCIEVGSEGQALVTGRRGPVIDLQIAQRSAGSKTSQILAGQLGQWQYRLNQFCHRRDSDAISLQSPALFSKILLSYQCCIPPTIIIEGERQPVELEPVALARSVKVGIYHEILDR